MGRQRHGNRHTMPRPPWDRGRAALGGTVLSPQAWTRAVVSATADVRFPAHRGQSRPDKGTAIPAHLDRGPAMSASVAGAMIETAARLET